MYVTEPLPLQLLSRPPGHGYIGSEAFKLQKGFALFFGDWLCSDGRGSVSSFAHSLVEGGEEAGRAAAPSSGPMKPGRAKGAAAVLAAPGGPLDVVGRFFPSENFIGRHSVPGVLGMASTGMHGSGSAFYITLAPAPHLGRSSPQPLPCPRAHTLPLPPSLSLTLPLPAPCAYAPSPLQTALR